MGECFASRGREDGGVKNDDVVLGLEDVIEYVPFLI